MNRRQDPVTYRPFQTQPVLQTGLLPIERDDGDLYRRVASGLARIADTFAAKAEQDALFQGERDGQRAGLDGAPTAATVTGGEVTGTASVNGQAGHIKGAQGLRVAVPGDGTAEQQAMAILRSEEGFRDKPYWDVNAWRTGYGSDTTTLKDGRTVNVTRGMTVSKDDAERDLQHRISNVEGKQARDQVGDTWSKLPAATRGALYSVAYNYGSLPANVVAAAKSGDLAAVATAVRGLDSNTERRGREADLILHGANEPAILPDHLDGPVNVTAVRTPIEVTPGKASTFQPTNQNTVYGRAYDVAGMRTWLQMAKMTIVEEQAEIFDKYKDDPAQLEQAYGRLLQDHKREGVYFDEVAPEYELSFKSNAFDLVRQAKSEQVKKQAAVDQVDFLGRVSGLEDKKSQLLAGLDPRDPHSSAMLADMQGTIDSHYDSAVSRGIMSPAEGAKAKIDSKSAMVVPYYLKQATGLKTDEIETLHSQMAADYAAGKLTGVTASNWADIEQGLQGAIATRRTNDTKADKDLQARGDDVFHRILSGEPVAPGDIARIRTDAMTAPHGEEIVASTDARMRLANALRTQPIGTVETQLDTILKGDRDKASSADVEFARTQIAEVRKNLAVDPLGVAEKFGIIPAAPPIALDGLKDPAALRDALSYRRGAAVAAAQHFGVPVRYFRPGEADQVVQAAMQNPDAMVAFTLNVTQSFGKDTPAAMREISDAGPVMAHAVGTSVSTGDPSLARDVAQISQMKARKDYSVKMPEAGKLETKGSTVLAGALFAQPQMQNAALQTANLLYEKMAAEQGFDPADIKTPGSVAEVAYAKALDRALGGQKLGGVDTGGIGQVNDTNIIVPALMPKDRPEELIGGLTSKQLERLPPLGSINGVKITADQIRDGTLVSVGDGQYRVTLDDPQGDTPDYLIAPGGKPWVLDLRQLDRIAREKAAPLDVAPNRADVFEGNQ